MVGHMVEGVDLHPVYIFCMGIRALGLETTWAFYIGDGLVGSILHVGVGLEPRGVAFLPYFYPALVHASFHGDAESDQCPAPVRPVFSIVRSILYAPPIYVRCQG